MHYVSHSDAYSFIHSINRSVSQYDNSSSILLLVSHPFSVLHCNFWLIHSFKWSAIHFMYVSSRTSFPGNTTRPFPKTTSPTTYPLNPRTAPTAHYSCHALNRTCQLYVHAREKLWMYMYVCKYESKVKGWRWKKVHGHRKVTASFQHAHTLLFPRRCNKISVFLLFTTSRTAGVCLPEESVVSG